MVEYIDKNETIGRFKREHQKLQELVSSLSGDRALEPKTLGEWSIKDIVAHLAAWNWEATEEVDRVLKNEATWPSRYEDRAGEEEFNWREVERRRDKSWEWVLKDWDESFAAQIKRMERLSEEEWKRQSGEMTWSDGSPVCVYTLFAYEYEGEGHEGGHAKQIRSLLG